MMNKKIFSLFNCARACISGLALVICGTSAAVQPARAQEQRSGSQSLPAAATATPLASPVSARADDRYRIGPGDVLDIRVMSGRLSPELSRDNVRVDGRGMIRIPMIEDEVQAACLTEGELARNIRGLYLKYKNNPHVDVFVKEYNSQPVAVIGAVGKPGQFQLQRRVRLLELLTFAGGPSERAGARIQLVRQQERPLCERTPAIGATATDELANVLFSFDRNETLRGEERANPYVVPGDIISLPEADQAYVVGNVLRPSSIPLKEPITVTQAIAMSGGTMPDTKSDKVRIIRQVKGSTTKTEIYVDLKAIDKRQAEDVVLQANDIVDVPTSGGRRLLRSLVGAIVPTVGQLPVQVIR